MIDEGLPLRGFVALGSALPQESAGANHPAGGMLVDGARVMDVRGSHHPARRILQVM
jgi:hypothetical protein